jgi:hypothetical protein
MLGMSMLVITAVACGDDDGGDDEPGGGGRDSGTDSSGRGGASGAGSGGRGGSGGGGGGLPNSFEVTLDGCCTAEGVCGYISELRMMCITQSDLLDPPISAGPACDGPDVVDADGGADLDAGSDEGLPPVDPECPTYTGTYTPAP